MHLTEETFAAWYNKNKESLTTLSLEGQLREAFMAGGAWSLYLATRPYECPNSEKSSKCSGRCEQV